MVLGALHWQQIVLDHRTRMADVPGRAEDASRRLFDLIEQRLRELLESEAQRPYFVYAPVFASPERLGDDLSLQLSPLAQNTLRPEGVLSWFAYDRMYDDGGEAPVALFSGQKSWAGVDLQSTPSTSTEPEYAELHDALERYVARHSNDGFLRWAWRLEDFEEDMAIPLPTAAVHIGQGEELDCIRECHQAWSEGSIEIVLSKFHVQFYQEADDTPRLLAARRALFWYDQELDELREDYPCLRPLSEGFGFVQGFFIDPEWLFEDLPTMAANQALSGSERFLPNGMDETQSPSDHVSEVALVRELGFETNRDVEQDFVHFGVALDTADIEQSFRNQSLRFLGVAAMLVISLGTGMALLLRSVTRELAQARRTENFVASVTHELRTPLSAIRLHGEMLLDGWVQDADKRREYYARIVRETGRLSTLVERVLEKSRLASGGAQPTVLDLNDVIEELRPIVAERAGGEGEDVQYDLGRELPQALLTQEAVRGILINLVENARKYAPMQPDGEPILVRTAAEGKQLVLEVLDRGPGVPEAEAEHIFEAFYRIGDERTRTARGTGLGLHLVALHAESLGARASVTARAGGGARFRVAFPKA